jgi:uncharacterized protein
MKFEWDEAKRKANIQNHGLDFAHAPEVFVGDIYTILDDRKDYGEERFITFGLLRGQVVVIAHTERDDRIRVISMRKALKYEAENYFLKIGQ